MGPSSSMRRLILPFLASCLCLPRWPPSRPILPSYSSAYELIDRLEAFNCAYSTFR